MPTHINIQKPNILVDSIPELCPHHNQEVNPDIVTHNYFIIESATWVEIIFSCPTHKCGRYYTAVYKKNELLGKSSHDGKNYYELVHVYPSNIKKISVSELLKSKSPEFENIYNQANEAKAHGLNHVCGMGFRKSLEFLIKDFCISLEPDAKKQTIIKNKLLGQVIAENLDSEDLKNLVSRATWIGNDETHYVRKWEDKDINDLINMIDIAVLWIESKLKAKSMIDSMPRT